LRACGPEFGFASKHFGFRAHLCSLKLVKIALMLPMVRLTGKSMLKPPPSYSIVTAPALKASKAVSFPDLYSSLCPGGYLVFGISGFCFEKSGLGTRTMHNSRNSGVLL
jgi:hypothetical protein